MVGLGDPSHWTMLSVEKSVPFTVRVKVGLPAMAEVGAMLARTGSGLSTVKVDPAEVPPPGVGVKTVTVAVHDFEFCKEAPISLVGKIMENGLTSVLLSPSHVF